MGVVGGGSWRVLWCVLVLAAAGEASLGDRLVPYRECVGNCSADSCGNATSLAEWRRSQATSQWLLGWSCEEECGHTCMWRTLAFLRGINFTVIPQFYGKWPFRRLWGIQEPASVLFSLTNLAAFLVFLARLRSQLPSDAPLLRLWTRYAHLGIFTWLSSSLYHTRDTPTTERLDYFCAFGSILFGLYAALVRLVGQRRARLPGRLLALYLALHVAYLSFWSFDYSYNMSASLAAGVGQAGAWVWWMWGECGKDGGWKRVRPGLAAVVWTVASLGLEVQDFPPLWETLDAHALWHLSTTPIPLLWSSFVVKDSLYLNSLKLD